MANLAVFASGSGSNFQVIAEAVLKSSHSVACLICDKKKAYAAVRAQNFGIPCYFVSYKGKKREEAEEEIIEILKKHDIQLVALAGYMRLLSPVLVDFLPNKIINIHPALLPKFPGTHGIEESYNSGDKELGISIHRVDYGMDTGPIIIQKSFIRSGEESLEEIEEKIHALEHQWYPQVVLDLLDDIG